MDFILENYAFRFPSEHHVPPSHQPVLQADLMPNLFESEARVEDRPRCRSESRQSSRAEMVPSRPGSPHGRSSRSPPASVRGSPPGSTRISTTDNLEQQPTTSNTLNKNTTELAFKNSIVNIDNFKLFFEQLFKKLTCAFSKTEDSRNQKQFGLQIKL